MKILVTGGTGFIGSAVVLQAIRDGHQIINVDCLTYAAATASLDAVADHPAYAFAQVDIRDRAALDTVFAQHQPDVVMHLAAESHVDRSIEGPAAFIETNLIGTFNMLSAALEYWRGRDEDAKEAFRFHHISTDEVFGALGDDGFFTEETAYDPRSPYSASKAGSDHLVSAWHHTYGMPVLLTNCSNNYGPYHFPEKLIPLMIIKCLAGENLPVYGDGSNVRDWLYVEDHVRAMLAVVEGGTPGESYMVGGNSEQTNLRVVEVICETLDRVRPREDGKSYKEQISFVTDRPGHDFRYAIDASKLKDELGWEPVETFESGMERTINWYLDNETWWQDILSGAYRGERLGLDKAKMD